MSAPFQGSHFSWTQPGAVWEQLLRPWFEACALSGWEGPGAPVPVLLVPDAGLVAWVKGQLAAAGIGCLGVQFHTPGTLRALLARAYGIDRPLALREDLHLIMQQAARALPGNPVAEAAALDPASLCRLCDRADRAGWRAQGLGTAAGRELAQRYFDLLAAQGLHTVAQVEREILLRAQEAPLPACGYLLVAGFGAEHGESLLLLRAAALSARNPILCLDCDNASSASGSAQALAWAASCEEFFGQPQPIAVSAAAAHSAGAESAEAESAGADSTQGDRRRFALESFAAAFAGHSQVDPDCQGSLASVLRLPTFRTLGDEVQGVVAQVCRWLAQSSCGSGVGSGADSVTDSGAARPASALPRIGILLPEGGSLAAREIASQLAALGIGHYDSLGHQPARQPGQALLERWCAWQTSNQLDDFNAFFAELARQGHLLPGVVRGWERQAERALSQTLCAELDVVRAYLHSAGEAELPSARAAAGVVPPLGLPSSQSDSYAPSGSQTPSDFHPSSGASAHLNAHSQPGSQSQTVARGSASAASPGCWQEALAQWPALPAQGSFAELWQQALPVLQRFGWPERLESLQQRAEGFAKNFTAALPRTAFLGWLTAVTRVPGRTRAPGGREPFATVHLLTVAEASRQSWTHLCAVGMVNGLWPPGETESALLDGARCALLNRRAEQPSRFGQGQRCIGGNHTYLSSATERREDFNAAFVRLLQHSGAGVVVFGRHRFDPAAPQSELFASELFLRGVYAATGSLELAAEDPVAPAPGVLPAAAVGLPAGGTGLAAAHWQGRAHEDAAAGDAPPAAGGGVGAAPAFAEVAEAYRRRRDPACGFDAYSYALSARPAEPLLLSCSHWESALRRPASAWYRYVLRLSARELAAERDVRRQSRGVWVHRWLNPTADAAALRADGLRGGAVRLAAVFVPRPGSEAWLRQVGNRAEGLHRLVAAAYAGAGRQLPQWWLSDWSAALALASRFASMLGSPGSAAGATPAEADSAQESSAPGVCSQDATSATCAAAGQAGSCGQWAAVAGEFRIDPVRFECAGHPLDGVSLFGSVDLLLAPAEALGKDFSVIGLVCASGSAASAGGLFASGGQRLPLLVADYKTGRSDSELKTADWQKDGTGLQLVLYALALQALGAQSLQLAILKEDSDLSRPQLTQDDLSADSEVWKRLAVLMRRGVFGARGALRDRFSFGGEYPLATLEVDPRILERKATLTFG